MNPHPMLALNAISPRSIRSAAGYAPSGSLTAGIPGATIPAGAFRFRSSIRVVGYRPSPNQTTMGAALQAALRQLAPTAATTTFAVSVGNADQVTLTSAVTASPRTVDSWWLTLTGTLAVTAPTRLAAVNQAIARAVYQAGNFASTVSSNGRAVQITVPTGSAMERPSATSQRNRLWELFQSSNGCAGAGYIDAAIRQACTRWEPMTAVDAFATAQGAANAAQAAITTCTFRSIQAFFLRPTATFAQTGPRFNAGTEVTITGPQHSVQGSLTLFPVRVGTQTGFAAFNAQEVALCRAAGAQRAATAATQSIPGAPALPNVPSLPGLPSVPGTPTAAALCSVTSAERFWLRPTRTFDRVGPQFNPGTRLDVLAGPFERQGNLALFEVRVGSQTGFAALNPQEVASCPAAQRFTAQSSAPSTPSSTPAPAPSTTAVTTAPSTTLATQPQGGASISQRGMSQGAKTALIVGGTAVALTGVGLGLYYALGTLDKPAPRARG
jgi:hypothetical protein